MIKHIAKRWNKMMERNGILASHRECEAQGSNKFFKEINLNNRQNDEMKRNDSYLMESTLCEKRELLSVTDKLSVINGINL